MGFSQPHGLSCTHSRLSEVTCQAIHRVANDLFVLYWKILAPGQTKIMKNFNEKKELCFFPSVNMKFRRKCVALDVLVAAMFWYGVGLGKDSPGGTIVKNRPASAGDARDMGLIPGSGRSLGIGNGTHFSILAWKIPWTEEPDRLYGVAKGRTWPEHAHPGHGNADRKFHIDEVSSRNSSIICCDCYSLLFLLFLILLYLVGKWASLVAHC